jgi:hypothetical protein
MKTIFLFISLFALFGLSISAFGQSLERNVIANSGGSGSGAGINIDYTIGETLVQTYTGSSNILTQGFHQPASGNVSVENITDVIDYNVFPNPFTDIVQFEIDISQPASIELKLCDITGRMLNVVNDADYNQGRHILFLTTANLASGSYLLVATVTEEGKLPVYLSKKIQLIR